MEIAWIEIDLHPPVTYGAYELIYMNLKNSQHILVNTSHSQFYPHRGKKRADKRGKISLTPLIKAAPTALIIIIHDQNSGVSTFSVPNFVKISDEVWK
jgi:hypothetical protein